jgi:hypothetical protein
MNEDLVFEVLTPLGFMVRTTETYWDIITTIKHPSMRGREAMIERTLRAPEQIRQSRTDPEVYLFYWAERPGRWLCAVARRLNGDGFLITAYPTDAIKEGTRVWTR